MKIKDIELKSGIDRGTIYYYEKEGLMTPERSDNGYRKYSEEDLLILKKIKLLRSLHFPVSEIKSLIQRKGDFREVLLDQITRLDKEGENVSHAKEVCRNMYVQESSFENLDVLKYLDQVHEISKEEGSRYFKVQEEIPQVFNPERRFLARLIDTIFYSFIWNTILSIFGRDILQRRIMEQFIDIIVVVFIMLLLEPILIRLFKTTFGKMIFGMTIESPDGNRLSLGESFNRTLGVISKGLGFGIPLINWITLSVSYERCKRGEIQPWDENIAYRIKDYKNYRYGIMVLSILVVISLETLLSLNYFMPPHSGNLTVEQYVENFEHYEKIYRINLDYELKPNGAWDEIDYDYKKKYLPHHLRTVPTIKYSLNDGIINAVSFEVKVEDNEFYIESYENLMTLLSLSLITPSNIIEAQNEMNQIYQQVKHESFKTFNLDAAGISVVNAIEYGGFEEYFDHLEPKYKSNENYFHQEFTVSKK